MGGNVFKDTQSIKIGNIKPTIKKYFDCLSEIFPQNKDILNNEYFHFVGSSGKKPISGDIDLAVDTSTIIDNLDGWELNPENVKKQFDIFKKRARTATDNELMIRSILKGIVDKINTFNSDLTSDPKKVTSGNIFSSYPQYSSSGTKLDYSVQIDWMVGNLEWLEFSYYSSVYSGNVKGLHRTQLILSMFQNLNLSFNHTKGVTDKETSEVIATNPQTAIKILEDAYGIDLPQSIIQDYYKLINIVNNLNKIDRNNILDVYFKILDSTRADIPLDLQCDWIERKSNLGLTGKFLPEDSNLLKEI